MGGAGSASGRPGLTPTELLQLTYLDAVRQGTSAGFDLKAELGPAAWHADWATDTDLDPRLNTKLHVGPVIATAWGAFRERPYIAVSTHEPPDRDSASHHPLRIWDLDTGQGRELNSGEPCGCLAFAELSGGFILVSGHRDGVMRIWDAVDLSLVNAVVIGSSAVRDVHVAQVGGSVEAVTLDAAGHVRCWSLPDGAFRGRLGVSGPFCMAAGRLVDGRPALAIGGDDVTLWDLHRRERVNAHLPLVGNEVRAVALSTFGDQDCLTVLDNAAITSFDIATGALVSQPIVAHRNRRPRGLKQLSGHAYGPSKISVVDGVIAVPTPSRVHLWDLAGSTAKAPTIAGPVRHSVTASVTWQGTEMLLTGSYDDGVVAIWDLAQPVSRAPGHDELVSNVVVSGSELVVSVDEGGTVVARHRDSGLLAAPLLATAIEDTCALAAWSEAGEPIVATGAGSDKVSDGYLRRWNLARGAAVGVPVKAHLKYLRWLSWTEVDGAKLLVTFGPGGELRIWDPRTGSMVAEAQTGLASRTTGFAVGVVDGRPAVALSSATQPMRLHMLDDLSARPLVIPEAGSDIALALVGHQVVTAHFDDDPGISHTYRVWHTSGERVGHEGAGGAPITAAALRAWPTMYFGRADGSITVTDVETGRDLCPPLLLPTAPRSLASTHDGALVVAFGSDVAVIRPPVSSA